MYSDVTSVNLICVSDKIINNSDNFKIKCLSNSKISAFFCVFTLFYLILENISTNVRKLFFFLYLTFVTSCIIGPFFRPDVTRIKFKTLTLSLMRWRINVNSTRLNSSQSAQLNMKYKLYSKPNPTSKNLN